MIGLILMVYSWFLSYPLSIDSSDDFVFNHVSVLYWYSLALTLPSMYLIAVTSKRGFLKWIMTLGIFMMIFSLSYFYYMLPGSDSHHTTGLTQFFIKTRSLDYSQPGRSYFQWPAFFILSGVLTSVSGLELATVEFLSYAIIGFLMATALYVHASKAYKNGGFLAVIAFFVVLYNYLNYQFAPFSLAFGLLLLLFMLESRPRSSGLIVTALVLFLGISLMHAFVPIFFILYLLVQYIISRKQQYGKLCLLTSIIYLLVEFAMAPIGFAGSILSTMSRASDYSIVMTIKPTSTVSIDATAQVFSRAVPVIFGVICLAGFIALLAKRKIRRLDGALLACGLIYSGLGLVLYTLGTRAIPIAFIPISLGASYLFESRFRPYLVCLFLVVLTLVAFIPLHTSFADSPITFQTKEAHTTADFMIDKYDWNTHGTILAHVSDRSYIVPQIEGNAVIYSDFSSSFQNLSIETFDSIIYSVGLAKSLQKSSLSEENASRQILGAFNIIYNSGFSYIAEKPK